MSHTKGPWNSRPAGEGSSESFYVLTDADMQGPWIASVNGTHVGDKDRAVNEANARLIAAAPELLEALKDIEKHHVAINGKVGRGQEFSATLRIARAAIAKATGGAQ